MSERCEWNPEANSPAEAEHWRRIGVRSPGCANPAVWSVGAGTNNWHLCESCAALPRFKRYRSRVRIGTPPEEPRGVYGEMCRDPKACAGKGYCPRDPACNE